MMVVVINTTVFQSDLIGRVVDGKFPLLEWLGSSESGAVFRTELQGSQSQRASIRLIAATDEGAQARLDGWKEAAAWSHPHLMRVFDFGRCKVGNDEVLYAVTEFADEALSQVLPERSLTPAEAREMLSPVLDALSYVHDKGQAYGRLKPSQVMVVQDQMKLPVDVLYRVGSLRKPPAAPQIYDAPERATGAISAASDIWSLGVTLVEALTQHTPVWDRLTSSDPTVPNSIPQPFGDIARKCLRREPARRVTLNEIQVILDPARPVPVTARKAEGTVRPTAPEPARRVAEREKSKRRVFLLLAVVLVLCVVVASLLLNRTKPSPAAEKATVAPALSETPTTVSTAPTATASGSSSKGEVVERVMPEISAGANGSIHGKFAVSVRVSVDAKGDVSNAVFESHGPSRYFANQSLEAARSWKFKAAQASGQPIASEWVLQFEFRRDRTDCNPVEVSP